MHWSSSSTQFRLSCFFFHRKSFSFFADPPLQKNLCKKQFSSLQFSEKRRRARFQQQERIQLRDNPHYIQKNLTKQISVVDFGLGWESHHLPQFVISTLCPFVNYRQILEEGTNKSKAQKVKCQGKIDLIFIDLEIMWYLPFVL